MIPLLSSLITKWDLVGACRTFVGGIWIVCDPLPPCASFEVVKIDPLHFLAGCRKRQIHRVLSVLSLSIRFFSVLLFIRAPFCVWLFCRGLYSVFWLFWLSYQYLPSDWLERLLWGRLFVARELSPQSRGWRVFMIFLFFLCIVSLFNCVFVLSPGPT